MRSLADKRDGTNHLNKKQVFLNSNFKNNLI